MLLCRDIDAIAEVTNVAALFVCVPLAGLRFALTAASFVRAILITFIYARFQCCKGIAANRDQAVAGGRRKAPETVPSDLTWRFRAGDTRRLRELVIDGHTNLRLCALFLALLPLMLGLS